jgi:hypothetical protein
VVAGLAALGGGGGEGSTKSFAVPATSANPAGQAALTEFGVECLDGRGPKLAMNYVWDPATQEYRGVPGDVNVDFKPSPDGKRALVLRGVPAQSWAVAGWSDAVAGQVVPHPVADGIDVKWTEDGTQLVSMLTWDGAPDKSQNLVLKNKTVDFYDPATGSKTSVAVPQQVLDRAASNQWALQQWQGNANTLRFLMVSVAGDRMEWMDAHGKVVQTQAIQNGLRPSSTVPPMVTATVSPDGRYLLESDGMALAVFDLHDDGKRISESTPEGGAARDYFTGWTGTNQIVLAVDEADKNAGSPGWKEPKTGHSPLYQVLSPELKVVQEQQFTIPADPQGYCASWPMSWASRGQFPGAFVP